MDEAEEMKCPNCNHRKIIRYTLKRRKEMHPLAIIIIGFIFFSPIAMFLTAIFIDRFPWTILLPFVSIGIAILLVIVGPIFCP